MTLVAALLSFLSGWLLRARWDEHRARRASLRRLTEGHRRDLAIDTAREIARRERALEEANLAWSDEPKVISLERWRERLDKEGPWSA